MSDYFDMLTESAATDAPLVPLRPAPLEDVELREEIELLFHVVASVADCPHHLTAEQVDAALGLPVGLPGASRHRLRADAEGR